MKRGTITLIALLVLASVAVTGCSKTTSPTVINNFTLRIATVGPQTNQGVLSSSIPATPGSYAQNYDFATFQVVIIPPGTVTPNLRYFIQIYSTDGKFFDNASTTWTMQELAKPEPINTSERDIRKIQAYETAIANWPPSKTISLRVPFFDKAVAAFQGEYNLKNGQSLVRKSEDLQYSLSNAPQVSNEDLNTIFNKYFRLTISE